jgi:ribosome maturation factor RimP
LWTDKADLSGEVAMYIEGDRVVVTAWELDLQRTEVLHGTVVEVGTNDLIVEMDDGERRQFKFDEVQKIGP